MPRTSPVPTWVPDLPKSPGVYCFTSEAGAPLYIGKAVNLHRRVRSYFYSGGPEDTRLGEMLGLARDVRITRTGSDLEARLIEAERILAHRPPYNRALKSRGRGWYLEMRWREPFPRFRLVRRPGAASGHHFGPFWGRRLPDRLRRLTEKIFRLRSCAGPLRPDGDTTPCMQHGLGLCTAPCALHATLNAYRQQAEQAVRLLSDREYGWDLQDRVRQARDAATAELNFERAAELQLRLGWLDELSELRWALDDDFEFRSWLIVLTADDEGKRLLLPVARGRVLRRRYASWEPDAWEREVEDACYAVRVAELRAPQALDARDSVPAGIVARWIEAGGDGGLPLDLNDLDSRGAIDVIRAGCR